MDFAKYLKFSALFIPILFLLVGFSIHLPKFDNDPNYVYLVNSTALSTGKSVGYIDHPGTTVIQIGSLTIALKHWVSNPEKETLTNHVLNNPHSFILSIRNVLLVLNGLILLLLGWISWKKIKSIWVALLLQASTLITINTLDHIWTKVSPEPLLFFITCIFVAAVLLFYYERNKESWKYVFIFALIIGAGLGTKATFLPLAFFPFIVLPTLKKKILFLLSVISSFVIFTIPIIPEYKYMYHWFMGLVNHTGIYGHGESGFIDLKTYIPNIFGIIKNNGIFSVAVFMGVIVVLISIYLALKHKKAIEWETKILGGLVASSGIGILMVAKHYHSNHYLIPVLLLTGITIFFIHQVIVQKTDSSIIKKIQLPLLVISLLIFLGSQQPKKIKYFNDGYKITNVEMDSTSKLIDNGYSDYARVYYYPNSLNKYSALNFGDVYAKRQLLPQIKDVHGDIYFYYSDKDIIKNWDTEIFIDELIKKYQGKLLFYCDSQDQRMPNKLKENGLPISLVNKGRIQSIYKFDIERYNTLIAFQNNFTTGIIHCGAEVLTDNNKYYIGSNGEVFGVSTNRSNRMAHSGNYSFKMDRNTEFTLEYSLNNLSSSNIYEVEIWRHSKSNGSYLVIASNDVKQFYKAQNNIVETDENGWGLLKIKFKVTPNLHNKSLKIYLWNKDKKLGYFDDLTIRKIESN